MSSPRSSVSDSSGGVSSFARLIPLESDAQSNGTRRGPLNYPAILLLVAAVVLFAAYTLGYIQEFGSLLGAAIRSGPNAEFPGLGPVFYGIAGLVAFLLLLALLRSVDALLRRIRGSSSLANRPAKSLAEFLEEAAGAKIGVRVARESYHLLQPHYPHRMCIDLADRLRDDLRLEEEQIRLLGAKLFSRCDRRGRLAEAAAADVSELLTVFDLLGRVEAASPLGTESPSGARARLKDLPGPLPGQAPLSQNVQAPDVRLQESRNPTSAQRKALHAAALHAIESRSMRVAQTSGPHRRSSDYEGPRRRATDKPSEPSAYRGPYRRFKDSKNSKDQMAASNGSSSSESKLEHDPTELNRPDPRFAPQRNRRRPEPGTTT